MFDKLKDKLSSGSSNSSGNSESNDSNNSTDSGPQEQQFKIQPYPPSDGPEDLQPDRRAPGRGNLNFDDDKFKAFNTPGPVVPNAEIMQNIPPPKSREELQARQAQLNAQSNGN